jgi:hypothetical protein
MTYFFLIKQAFQQQDITVKYTEICLVVLKVGLALHFHYSISEFAYAGLNDYRTTSSSIYINNFINSFVVLVLLLVKVFTEQEVTIAIRAK